MRIRQELTERARSLVFGGDWTPPQARSAATVVLLRDGPQGLEVLLLEKALGFARGMYVFPGGALEPADADLGDPWRIAAIRETFEEVGVLIAVPDPATSMDHLRDVDFRKVLQELRVAADEAALQPFAHWVTPEVESRRFDTKFYAVGMPAGQEVASVTSEHHSAVWVRPADAMGWAMLPPTAAVLAELRTAETVADVLAVPRTPVPVMPHPVATAGGDIDWVLVDARTGEPLA